MGEKLGFYFNLLIFFSASFFISANNIHQEEISEVLKECNQSVVKIIAYDSNKREIAAGKGTIVSPDGLVLTNYHLVCQANSAKASLPGGKIRRKVEWEDVFHPSVELSGIGRADEKKKAKKKSKGKWVKVEGIVNFDKNLDFALIKLEKKGQTFSQLSISGPDRFEIGENIFIIADEESVSEAVIIGTKEFSENRIFALLNLSLSAEMTGSPIFSSQGQIRGFVCNLTPKSHLIIPASYALPLIKKEKTIPLSKFSHEDYFTTPEGLNLKALAYSITDNYNKALSCLQESARMNPKNPYAFSQLGYLYSKLNQYEKAVEVYSQALSLNPNDYKASFGLGMAYIKLNQYQKAISPLTQCTSLNPEFPDAFYNLGLAYQILGQLEKAAEVYQHFIKINPGPAWTGFNQLGTIYVKLSQYDKAIAAFQEVIKIKPSDLKATYNLAYSYDMSGQYEQAALLYRKLVNLNPKDAKAYYGLLFRLYDKAGQYDKALEACQEILRLSPNNANNFYNLGIIYTKLKNYEKAIEAFKQSLSLDPNFAPAIYNIGLVYFKQKKYVEAINAFKKFTSLKPENPDAYYNIGAGYLQLKKYEQAIKPLQHSIQLKPDYAVAHYNLAIAYYVVKDRFSANEEYKILQNLNPELAEKLRKIIKK